MKRTLTEVTISPIGNIADDGAEEPPTESTALKKRCLEAVPAKTTILDILLSEYVTRRLLEFLTHAEDLLRLIDTNSTLRRFVTRSTRSLNLNWSDNSSLFSPLLGEFKALEVLNLRADATTLTTANEAFLNEIRQDNVIPCFSTSLTTLSLLGYWVSPVVPQQLLKCSLPCLRTLAITRLRFKEAHQLDQASYPSLTNLTVSFSVLDSGEESSDVNRLFATSLKHLSILTLLPMCHIQAFALPTIRFNLSQMSNLYYLTLVDNESAQIVGLPRCVRQLRLPPSLLNWADSLINEQTKIGALDDVEHLCIFKPGARAYLGFSALRDLCTSLLPNLQRLESALVPGTSGIGDNNQIQIASSVEEMEALMLACPKLSSISGDFVARTEQVWSYLQTMPQSLAISPADAIVTTPGSSDYEAYLAHMPPTHRLIVHYGSPVLRDLSASARSTIHTLTFSSRTSSQPMDLSVFDTRRLPHLTSLQLPICVDSSSKQLDFSCFQGLKSLKLSVSSDNKVDPYPHQWHGKLRDALYSLPSSIVTLQVRYYSDSHVDERDVQYTQKTRDASVNLPHLLSVLPNAQTLNLQGCIATGFDDRYALDFDLAHGTGALRHPYLRDVKIVSYRGYDSPLGLRACDALVRNVSQSALLPSLESFQVCYVLTPWIEVREIDGDRFEVQCTPTIPEKLTSHLGALSKSWSAYWRNLPGDSISDFSCAGDCVFCLKYKYSSSQ